MLAGASSARRPWQTTLYSSNPKVLKQHLTKIEVGFVIAEEEGKKMTDGKYEKERFSALHIDSAHDDGLQDVQPHPYSTYMHIPHWTNTPFTFWWRNSREEEEEEERHQASGPNTVIKRTLYHMIAP